MQTSKPYRIRRNRSGFWEIVWPIPAAQSGKDRATEGSWSTKQIERGAAELAAEEFWRQKINTEAASNGETVRQIAKLYLNAATKVRKITDAQEWALKPIIDTLGNIPVGQVTKQDTVDYCTKRSAKGISDWTIRRELSAFKTACTWAAESNLIARHEIPFVEMPPEGEARFVWLDKPDEQKFWDMAMDDKNRRGQLSRVARFVAIALTTAARSQAIHQVTWQRIHYERGKRGVIDFRVPGRAKSNKRRVAMPIPPRLLPILKQADAERKQRGEPDTHPIIGHGSLRTAWENWIAKTPYQHINRHDLRRTCASLAVQRGVPLLHVAKLLGDTEKTVEKHYGFLRPDHLEEVMEEI